MKLVAPIIINEADLNKVLNKLDNALDPQAPARAKEFIEKHLYQEVWVVRMPATNGVDSILQRAIVIGEDPSHTSSGYVLCQILPSNHQETVFINRLASKASIPNPTRVKPDSMLARFDCWTSSRDD